MAIGYEDSPVIMGNFLCHVTRKIFTYESIRKTWKCSCCDGPIDINVTFSNNKQSVINRIKASEVINGNILLIPGTENGNIVLNVNNENDIIYMALKGYGHMHWKASSFVNIINGSWAE